MRVGSLGLWNQTKTVLLLGALSALIVGVAAAFAPEQVYLFAALAAAMNLGAYFFSDRIVLAMHGAREVSAAEAPRLHAMVDDLAQRAGIPKPRVCVMEEPQPNAFATGRNPAHGVVAVTTGILDLLSRRELRAVLAHEIAHIRNRDILVSTIAAALASVVTYLANALSFGAMFARSEDDDQVHASGVGGLALAFVAPIAATLVQLGISRSREYLADETGAALCGDPEALAHALVKLEQGAAVVRPLDPQPATAGLFIVSPFAGRAGAVLSLFSTHPSVQNRVEKLMALASRRRPRHRTADAWAW